MDEQGYKREQLTPETQKEIERMKARAMNEDCETESERIGAKLTAFDERREQRSVSTRADRKSIASAQRNQRRQNLPHIRKRG